MKKFFILLLFFIPGTVQATKLAVCDGKSYDVTITNGGEIHKVTLTPFGGSIEEFGPVVTLQIAGHPPVTITEPYDEYCIWHGKITLQRRNFGNDAGGGFSSR